MDRVNFNLLKKSPNSLELKAYLYQLKSDSFGLSDSIQNAYREKTGNDSNEGIDTLSDAEIQELLGECTPSCIIYFRAHLDAIEEEQLHYTTFPELFTDIKQVSFDCGGIISLESYRSQIYSLFNAQGKRLSSYCHDLDIGMDGLILMRSSSGPFWELLRVNGDQLIETYHPRPHEAMHDFPDLMYRDTIKECSSPAFIHITDGRMSDLAWQEVHDILTHRGGDYRSLCKYYSDDEILAILAIDLNVLAFTYLSPRLKNNREFILSLLKKGGDHLHLYSYLNDDLKRDLDIIKLCLDFSVNIIYRGAPIDDYEIMKRATHAHWPLFEYASEHLQSDKEFILELATNDWMVLKSTRPEIYTDADFVERSVLAYNDCHVEKVDLTEVFSHLIHQPEGHLLIDSLLPIHDEDLFLRIIQSVNADQLNHMISGLSQATMQKQEFWLKAAERNNSIVESIPDELRNNREFAMRLVQLNGDFLHALNPTFSSDPIFFISAMKQIKNRRGSTVISDLYPLLTSQLKGSRNFMFEAASLDFHILAHCSEELKGDAEFLLGLVKPTHGWSYAYAHESLKRDLEFIKVTLNINKYLSKEIPIEIIDTPAIQNILNEKHIDLNQAISDDDLPF
jgi:hypothetical protein